MRRTGTGLEWTDEKISRPNLRLGADGEADRREASGTQRRGHEEADGRGAGRIKKGRLKFCLFISRYRLHGMLTNTHEKNCLQILV
ncbi:hypothetical protein BDA96_03G148500 [Sorghum bicolor]|uniref:Uncharacterized protein n=1 Tax=Sorghum bicolor TaxID=4558 RepID=A0A921RCV9_SORBI|nr:hypothetical protein BDA96_03G148500 [Sorghum bicolor]